MNYLHWDEKTIDSFDDNKIAELYDKGYVFTRINRGVMQQTRSIRIDLTKFSPSSENRRILKKVESVNLSTTTLPIDADKYDWSIGKLAKDFYESKFGPGIMSAQKIKEMLTSDQSNFNLLLEYAPIGYTVSYLSPSILHYSYPFYDLESAPKDMGMGMMIKAIIWAKEKGLKYIYLGSLQRPGDVYKLQFDGIEWFDGSKWSTDIDSAKEILKS